MDAACASCSSSPFAPLCARSPTEPCPLAIRERAGVSADRRTGAEGGTGSALGLAVRQGKGAAISGCGCHILMREFCWPATFQARTGFRQALIDSTAKFYQTKLHECGGVYEYFNLIPVLSHKSQSR